MGKTRASATGSSGQVVLAEPLAPFVGEFEVSLKDAGYASSTVVNELCLMGHLSRWLEDGGLTAADLTEMRVEQFQAQRRAAGVVGFTSRGSLSPLLEVLGGLGVLPPKPAPLLGSPVEVLLGAFGEYLLKERGLAASTAAAYVLRTRRFLHGCGVERPLTSLTTGDVTAAVLRESDGLSVGAVQMFVASVRAFLRYCFIADLIEVDLSAAALAMTGRRRSSLPQRISTADAQALLNSCDRERSIGRRDYAVLVTLLRLGLRASEIAAVTLEDLDWRVGELVVHGKGTQLDRLPLPEDVGAAIAGYLQRGRPSTACRQVFLRAQAPMAGLGRGAVSCIVRRACLRAGLAPVGAHRLRHSLASQLVAAGVPLPQIGQVLRQRSAISTAQYARVDVEQLRSLALPWPTGAPS